ncbi:MAG: hypothetical protein GY854_25030 [Deltaproteobacteria bacterium]|nr:hypothetical protein [Deltaproteobacteria bacterium]
MMEWYEALTTLQKVFFIFASIGSFLFLIQLVMMLVGGGDTDTELDADVDMDVDTDIDTDADADGHADAHANTEADFKIVSVQGTMAFFMMLGWIGLAANRTWGMGIAGSIGIGCAAGFAANLFIAKTFQFFKRLQSSGTMKMGNAVGQEGEVYLTIKKGEPGKVRVSVQEHLKVFDAMSADGEELPTGTAIKVVRVIKGNTMIVKRM